MNPIRKYVRFVLLGGCVFLLVGCLALSIYRVSVWQENKACYKRLGVEYSVDPTYSLIGNAMVGRIYSQAQPTPTYLEVLLALSDIAPIVPFEITTLSSGELKQRISMMPCKYPENGFDFMVLFSEDGVVRDLKLYLDD